MKISFGSYVGFGKVQNNNEKPSSLKLNTLKQDTFTKNISFEGNKKTKQTSPKEGRGEATLSLEELNKRIQEISNIIKKIAPKEDSNASELATNIVLDQKSIINYYYSAIKEGDNKFISEDSKDGKLNLEKIVKYILLTDKIETLSNENKVKAEYQKILNKTEYKGVEGKIRLFYEFDKNPDVKVIKRYENMKKVGEDIYNEFSEVVDEVFESEDIDLTPDKTKSIIDDVSKVISDRQDATKFAFKHLNLLDYYYSAVESENSEYISKNGEDGKLNLEKIIQYTIKTDEIESLPDDNKIKIEYLKLLNQDEYKGIEGKIKLFYEFNKSPDESVIKKYENMKKVGEEIYSKYTSIINRILKSKDIELSPEVLQKRINSIKPFTQGEQEAVKIALRQSDILDYYYSAIESGNNEYVSENSEDGKLNLAKIVDYARAIEYAETQDKELNSEYQQLLSMEKYSGIKGKARLFYEFNKYNLDGKDIKKLLKKDNNTDVSTRFENLKKVGKNIYFEFSNIVNETLKRKDITSNAQNLERIVNDAASIIKNREKAVRIALKHSNVFDYYYSTTDTENAEENFYIDKNGKNGKLNLEKIIKYTIISDDIDSLPDDNKVKRYYKSALESCQKTIKQGDKETQGKIKLYKALNQNAFELINIEEIACSEVSKPEDFVKISNQLKRYNELHDKNNRHSTIEFFKKYSEISKDMDRIKKVKEKKGEQLDKGAILDKFWLFPDVQNGEELIKKSKNFDEIKGVIPKQESEDQIIYDKKIATLTNKLYTVQNDSNFQMNCLTILKSFENNQEVLSYLINTDFLVNSQVGIAEMLNNNQSSNLRAIIKVCAKNYDICEKEKNKYSQYNIESISTFKTNLDKVAQLDSCSDYCDFALKIMGKDNIPFGKVISINRRPFNKCRDFCNFVSNVSGETFENICNAFKNAEIPLNDCKNFCEFASRTMEKNPEKTTKELCEAFKKYKEKVKSIKPNIEIKDKDIEEGIYDNIINGTISPIKIGLFKKYNDEAKSYTAKNVIDELTNKKNSGEKSDYSNILFYFGIDKEQIDNLNEDKYKEKMDVIVSLMNYMAQVLHDSKCNSSPHGLMRIIERYILTGKSYTDGVITAEKTDGEIDVKINQERAKEEIKKIINSALYSANEVTESTKKDDEYEITFDYKNNKHTMYAGKKDGSLISVVPEGLYNRTILSGEISIIDKSKTYQEEI